MRNNLSFIRSESFNVWLDIFCIGITQSQIAQYIWRLNLCWPFLVVLLATNTEIEWFNFMCLVLFWYSCQSKFFCFSDFPPSRLWYFKKWSRMQQLCVKQPECKHVVQNDIFLSLSLPKCLQTLGRLFTPTHLSLKACKISDFCFSLTWMQAFCGVIDN